MKFIIYLLFFVLFSTSCVQEELDTCIVKTTTQVEILNVSDLENPENIPTDYVRWNYLPHNDTMYVVYLMSEDKECYMTSSKDAKEQVLEQNKINQIPSISLADKAKAVYPNEFKLDENCDCK